MKIYFISGLGANYKAFEKINIPKGFEAIPIDWKIPEADEKLNHYVERMCGEVSVNQPFILTGLSFGGIIAQEMHRFIKPEKTILISTVKNRNEMPGYMKLSARTQIHKFVPISFFTSEHLLSYAFFRKLYSKKMPQLNDFFTHKDNYYLKWSVDKIVNWKPYLKEIPNLYHMHGTQDIIFPSKNIKNADFIENGSHIMVLQKPKEVNLLFNQYLKK